VKKKGGLGRCEHIYIYGNEKCETHRGKTGGEANLSMLRVPYLGRVYSQESAPLEDPDEGVRATEKGVICYIVPRPRGRK